MKDSGTSLAVVVSAWLRVQDPKTGEHLPDDRLAAEFAVVYQGGTETTSLTTAWAVYALFPSSVA